MHIELGVRTICEFAINEEYYLQSDIVSHLSGLVGQSVACIGSEECTIQRANVHARMYGYNKA